jgi:hypothetical protein
MEFSPALLGRSRRHAVRCEAGCRIYAVLGDPGGRWFREDHADVVQALADRATELDGADRLNAAVWAAVLASPEDERWLSYRGFGLDDRRDEP